MSSVSTIGREPLTIVEIDQDRCSRIYGHSPCQAALGVTGDTRCYNTIASCQDEDNFALGTPLTLRFVTATEATGLPKSAYVLIPSVISVSSVSTRINIGAGDPGASPLGQRSSVTIALRDHPYHDRVVDPYHTTRDFDPATQGTFWSKWLARNPYHQGRSIRVRQGYVGQTLEQMRVRHFVIERIEGPSDGVVKVIAKDPIRLLDNVRARAPSPSNGTLRFDVTDSDAFAYLQPGGVGNAEYPLAGLARIGSEIVAFIRSDDTLSLVGRGFHNTAAAAHEEGDVVQNSLWVIGQRVDLLLAQLMTTYAGIDPSYIPTAEWDAEADLWCTAFSLNAVITEPTGVASLIAEILANTGCFIWWDDQDQEIKFRATRPYFPLADAAAIEIVQDRHIVADSLEIEAKPDERITKVYLYWNQIDPTGAMDEPSNYARFRVLTDTESEAAIRYGDSRIKQIFCRWFDDTNDAATSVVGNRILERQRETPKLIKFETDAKETSLRAGSVIRLTHNDLVGMTGEAEPTLLQVTAAEEIDPGHRLAFEARPYLNRSRYCFIMQNSAPSHDTSPTPDPENGGWIAPNANGFDDGDLPFRIL